MKKGAAYAIVILSLASLAMPFLASAYTTPTLWPLGYWGATNGNGSPGLISCTGNYTNPAGVQTCQSLCDLIGTIINIIYFVITICLFILAPVLFAVGGIMVMMSGANPEMLGTGKKTLTGTVIGVVIVLCSYLIVATFVHVLNITGVGGFNASACNVAPNPATQGVTPTTNTNPVCQGMYAGCVVSTPINPPPAGCSAGLPVAQCVPVGAFSSCYTSVQC